MTSYTADSRAFPLEQRCGDAKISRVTVVNRCEIVAVTVQSVRANPVRVKTDDGDVFRENVTRATVTHTEFA